VQVLAQLDGAEQPAALNGALELGPPSFLPRLRPWPPHPDCECGVAQGGPSGER
jgi:hypothetical protein